MDDGESWISVLVVVALVWGGYAFFNDDESDERANSTYKSETYIGSDSGDDGYTWAENNDPTTFDECQDQFGTGSGEDDCNEYVKDNYAGSNTFNGYECTEDCSGHEAGYNWAEENDISDEYDCDGNSNSFNEGCVSYVEENY